jgi:hypothetical protein
MISKRNFIILIIGVISITYIYGILKPVNMDLDNYIYSPDKSKSLNFYNLGDGYNHIYLNYHKSFFKGGASVFGSKIDSNKIKVKWINNNHFRIDYPINSKISNKEKVLIYFSDTVFVEYKEY